MILTSQVALTVAFAPAGNLLATASHDRTIKLWDEWGQERGTLAGHLDWVRCLAFTADGKGLISGGDEGTSVCSDAGPAESLR